MTPNAPPLPLLVWPHTDAPTLASVAARVGDWPALLRQARAEALTGLLAARLSAARPPGVPPEVMAELERLRMVGGQRALRMAGQLLRILTLFEQHGIDALPIKGPALAQDVYGDPTVRSSYDLDIVVRFDDAPQARRLLLQNGFEDASKYNQRILAWSRRSGGEIHMWRSDGEPIVDLHWQITVALSTRTLSADHLLAGARTIPLLERTVRAPSLVDQLLLTLLHGSRHQWRPLELCVGVAVQVARLPAEAWPALCAAARDLGCLRRVTVGVVHACEPFDVAVPPEIRRLLAGDPVAGRYLQHLRRDGGAASARPSAAEHGEAGHFSRLWWQVRGEDTLLGTVDHLVVRSLRPGPEDWDALQLPEQLLWLHWWLRPFRLAAKYLRARAGRRSRGPAQR